MKSLHTRGGDHSVLHFQIFRVRISEVCTVCSLTLGESRPFKLILSSVHDAFCLSLAVSTVPVLADTHFFYSGFFAGLTVVGVGFGDATSSLTIVNNFTTSATSGQK